MVFGLACAVGELRRTEIEGALNVDAVPQSGDSGVFDPDDAGACGGWRGELELVTSGVPVVAKGEGTLFGSQVVGAENFAGDARHAFAIEDPSAQLAYLLTGDASAGGAAAELPVIAAPTAGSGIGLGTGGDIDADGYGDFLFSARDGIGVIYGPELMPRTLILDVGGFVSSADGVDVDADGYDDVCTWRHEPGQDARELRCIAGGARDRLPEFDEGLPVVRVDEPDYPGAGLFGDFDGDRSLDFALADDYGETIGVFSDILHVAGEWEDADTRLFEHGDMHGSTGFGRWLLLGDVDGDGEPSLVSVSSGGPYFGSHVAAFELPLPDGAWDANSVPHLGLEGPSSAYYGDAVVVDPELDGTDEVFVGWFDWYGGPGGVAVLDGSVDGVAAFRAADGADVQAVAAGDLDGDGCPELVVGSYAAQVESVVYIVK